MAQRQLHVRTIEHKMLTLSQRVTHNCGVDVVNQLETSLYTCCIREAFPQDSEANTSDFIENIEEMLFITCSH